jgi:small subunit ribosomal protein S19
MAKEIKYRGKTVQELGDMGYAELANLLSARARRNLKRGFSEEQKKLLKKIQAAKDGTRKKPVKTQCRDMIILPEMVGADVHIYNGKQYKQVQFTEEMIGHYLGEFSATRQDVTHKAPGVGATKGTKHASMK